MMGGEKSIGWRKYAEPLVLTLAAIILVLIDQAVKVLAVTTLVPGEPVVVLSLPVLGDVCLLVLVWNTGAFLSLGSGLAGPFHFITMIALPVAAVLGMVAYLFRPVWPLKAAAVPRSLGVALALAAAGGAGNLVDRISAGRVVDFLNFGIGWLRTGVMNVADLYIAAALVALLVYWWKNRSPRQR